MPVSKRKRSSVEESPAEGEGARSKRAKPSGQEPPLEEDGDGREEGKLSRFRISKRTRKLLKQRGVRRLFPIQCATFDHVFDGSDVIAQARTGTGKTLSFVLPLVELLAERGVGGVRGRAPQVLVMAPTRELARQVHGEFQALAPEACATHCVYGGVAYDGQEAALARGLDVLVGTPGRILDHMTRGTLDLSQLKHVVLDEADRMLEVGFADTVEQILSSSFPPGRDCSASKPQVLLFSATVPVWVEGVAERYMREGGRVRVDQVGGSGARTAVTVQHRAICCPYQERPSTISDVIKVYSGARGRTIIFTSTKQEANELALSSLLRQDCQVLHGDIPQRQREVTLKSFREGGCGVLVATDVAARGLDIPEVDLVILCEPPKDIESYIHRSGRTGRAGRTGVCILFYKLSQEHLLQSVERRAGIRFSRIGAPQPTDIIKAAARDAIQALEQVPPSILPSFQHAAEDLLKHRQPVQALAASLAYISGYNEIVSRSLLSAQQGFTTYLMSGSRVVRSPGYFWKVLEERFPSDLKQAVKGMRMCRDMKGVVFDLPDSYRSMVEEKWKGQLNMTLELAEKLPELQERPQNYFDRFKDSRGRQQNGYSYNTRQQNGRHGNRYRM